MFLEQKIGFDRVRGEVEGWCETVGGRDKLRGEGFSRSPDVILRRQRLADQMRRGLDEEPLGVEFLDVGEIVAKAEVEGTHLSVEEVVVLGRALRSVGLALDFLGRREGEELRGLGVGVERHREVLERVERAAGVQRSVI